MENIKKIKIFLSCPSDLVQEKDIVTQVSKILNEENRFTYEKYFNIQFDLEHWQKNVYLGEGTPRVQDTINNYLIPSCDIYFGIFWTRFGTPPGANAEGVTYGSGTEEEFYFAKKLKKTLWFLFYTSKIDPFKIDTDQIKMIHEFRKRLKQENIRYEEFSDKKDELRIKLRSILGYWFDMQKTIGLLENSAQGLIREATQNPVLPAREDFAKFNRGF